MDTRKPYQRQAKRRWPQAAWITGEGPYALLAHCRVLTVTLWPDLEQAEASKRVIDGSACGGLCQGRHEVVPVATA